MFHGNGLIDITANLLNENEKEEFKKFINTNKIFNRGNMFICKSNKIIYEFYALSVSLVGKMFKKIWIKFRFLL